MNRTIFIFVLAFALCCTMTSILIAQAPEAINYQAIARNSSGSPMSNVNLIVRLSIYAGATPTTKIYEENHVVTTNSTGLFSLMIGKGTVGMGDFSTIDWSSDDHHLQVEIDPGTGYVDLGFTQLLSVPYALFAKDVANDNDNQTLTLTDNNLSISGGNTVSFPAFGLSLPFADAINTTGVTAFDVANTTTDNGLAITGRLGSGSTIGNMTRAAIWGTTNTGHALVGFTSANGAYAGVWGRTNNDNGYGVHGSASGDGIGGFFQSNSSTGRALITSDGRVGIGVDDPEALLHVEGDLFINSSQGAIDFGYPNNGNQWHLSTLNAGADLQFFSKPNGSNTNTRRVFFQQDGRVGIGNTTNPGAQLDVLFNSTVSTPHILLSEEGNDYARISFQNSSGNKFWSIAGLNNTTTANERLNFYHSSTGDIISITGDGMVGIRTINPGARLHLFQGGQAVGTGLRFDDGINQDWDITHGFGLRFHFGGELRSFINATTGAYTQSSDARLKTDAEPIGTVLPNLLHLKALSYRYKNAVTTEKTLGFMAQDAQKLFPELVHYSEADDLYGINYAGFSVIAIKAIQEQQQVIEQQKDTIENLQKRLDSLEKLILENQKK